MLKLNQLLERFKNLTNNEKVRKQLIVEVLVNNEIPININQISISKNTIFIKTKPIIKTEVLLKKEKILKQIKEIGCLSFISNIQ
ncbi:MAG: hypothetical protein UU88_C0010G0006 [Parcubacteria group bacterium GW2011_GWC1_42_11]|uniref:Uncharacterized protein n=1 Tax=Candidatus Nomurabacteria bacterium GW2011_GWC2_42_20 TaxID=1618756 RepID=A0A0G0ZHW1_9BACT|nr:MAG: hypothetical protein UU88_C0010G0006 [Parcubacteria group bacterium GW2011_GWC1_42_11]KKS48264.1 MAG: hypothetical protein UV12_C0002G0113 [Candidatus Nomurabacteria bacterium GW2011_GWC2_42_20]KKT09837.1 MAG: hypothetical protein UV86_C0002G0080 [Candidatus Nomurabacteria bacterium GW2011_GWB1_43_20]HBH71843.1 hypothetical protein [Candidatus Yonathbacteria bacterium]